MSRVVDMLPDAVATIFKCLMHEPGLSRQELRRRVSGYLVDIETRGREADYINVGLAQTIANRCHPTDAGLPTTRPGP